MPELHRVREGCVEVTVRQISPSISLTLLSFNSSTVKEEQRFWPGGTFGTDFDCGSKSRVSQDGQAQPCSSCRTALSGSQSRGCLLQSHSVNVAGGTLPSNKRLVSSQKTTI